MEDKVVESKEERDKENAEELFDKIKSMVPASAGFVKAEFEGPDIAVYLKHTKELYENDTIIRGIASSIKKKLVIRSEINSLMAKPKAEEIIRKLVPADAGIGSIKFADEFSEVYIEALKPGLVIGKNGSTLKSIAMETAWTPKVLRTPTMDSDTLTRVRQLMFNEAEFRKKFLIGVGKHINSVIMKSEWLKATALGGYREVGRSSLLLETPHSKIILDCGLSPEPAIKGLEANAGSDINKAFPYLDSANLSINELDAVVLTHAHMDHIGFVPYLFKFGYEGPVYCTPPTRDMAALLLNDYIKLSARAGGTPLYGEKDIRKMLTHMITRDYGEVTNITGELKLTYHNAGHILGSSTVHLHVGEGMYNIVHTGDMKYGFTRLYDPASTKYPRIDALFIESTYGGNGDVTKNRGDAERDLMEVIKSTIKAGGKVIVPLFAVGRAQEMQMVLENYMMNKPEYKLDVPVYLDGMILEASAMHTAYPEYLKESLRNRILNNRSPFESEIFEIIKGEREEIFEKGPGVILASGGMMNGGASVEYFKRLADDSKNTIIFVGYNSSNSLGRRIQNGVKEIPLPDENGKLVPVKVNMNIRTVEGFSGHSDRHQLMSFVENLRPKPKTIFTQHGEEQKCEDLARSLGRVMHVDARAPMNLDSIRLK
ncbi:MAG: beta-CASP ribonuclease aCPSF1 [Candidatus Micrarchaeaceae archaeon]|nr:beta-CASP ribonuclease aCPSF1 [Candidatus Micrarchaeota archaeon]HII09887.1 beta-CASP ribonuclease aCPSF1 [Candidatus Micrarchaeota archaeon]